MIEVFCATKIHRKQFISRRFVSCSSTHCVLKPEQFVLLLRSSNTFESHICFRAPSTRNVKKQIIFFFQFGKCDVSINSHFVSPSWLCPLSLPASVCAPENADASQCVERKSAFRMRLPLKNYISWCQWNCAFSMLCGKHVPMVKFKVIIKHAIDRACIKRMMTILRGISTLLLAKMKCAVFRVGRCATNRCVLYKLSLNTWQIESWRNEKYTLCSAKFRSIIVFSYENKTSSRRRRRRRKHTLCSVNSELFLLLFSFLHANASTELTSKQGTHDLPTYETKQRNKKSNKKLVHRFALQATTMISSKRSWYFSV